MSQIIDELRKSDSWTIVRDLAIAICSKLATNGGGVIAHAFDHLDEASENAKKIVEKLLEIIVKQKIILEAAKSLKIQNIDEPTIQKFIEEILPTVSQIEGLQDFLKQPPTWDKIDAQLRLERIRIRNFRGITDIDLTIAPETQIICFVGPNGSGKSSLMSVIINALCQLTSESAPDLAKPSSESEINLHNRNWATAEIGKQGPAFAVRMDWKSRLTSHIHSTFIHAPEQDQHEYVTMLRQEFEVPSFPGWIYVQWRKRPEKDDLLAKSVFLVRPSDRFEIPYYEEPKNLAIVALGTADWEKCRLLPIQVKCGLHQIEGVILNLALDSRVIKQAYAEAGLGKILEALQALTDKKQSFLVTKWPFRRVGLGTLRALSLLSAGELDVLVTAANIVAQQIYLRHKFDALGDDRGMPSGWVFIDEIDAHLHPQWQKKVLPLLVDLFPTIHFVVSTHSPFVLQSLPKGKSMVVRLPDGAIFSDDFTAWNIEDILNLVFEIPSRWSKEVEDQLKVLEEAARTPEQQDKAIELYHKLAPRSNSLRAACDRIIAVYGDITLRDRIHNPESVKPL